MADPSQLLPAYLIIGTDRPKVRRAVARLRKRVMDESGSDLNIVILDAEHDSVEVLLDAAVSPGLTLGTRLLLVLNGHKWKAKARQAVVAYLQDPMPDTCVAVEAESLAASDALYKAVKKLGGVLPFDLPKKYEMAGWVKERAKANAPAAEHGRRQAPPRPLRQRPRRRRASGARDREARALLPRRGGHRGRRGRDLHA